MTNFKYSFFPLAVFILILCFNPSLAHNKSHHHHNSSSCSCSCPCPCPPSCSPTSAPPSSSPNSNHPSGSPGSGKLSGSPGSGNPSGSPGSDKPGGSSNSGSPSGSPGSGNPGRSPGSDKPGSSQSSSPPSGSQSSGHPSGSPGSSPLNGSPSSGPPSGSPGSGHPDGSPSTGPPNGYPGSSNPNGSSSSSSPFSYKGSFSKVYAFGDSYTDTGNCPLLGGLQSFIGSLMSHSPYGSSTSNEPVNRLCDGRLVIDFLTETLGLPPLPPYKDSSLNFSFGANFAISGSTSLPSDFFFNNKIVQSLMWKIPETLQTQINWFSQFLLNSQQKASGSSSSSKAPDMDDTLFWIGAVGLSDFARTLGSSLSGNLITKFTVQHVSQLLQTLLDKGAKYIVVSGLPPTGCTAFPLTLCPLANLDKLGCDAIVNTAIWAHNELLQNKLSEFQKQYSKSTILYVDQWNAYLTILKNPAKYGFQETFKACCGSGFGKFNFDSKSLCGMPGTSTCKDPSKYINWDGIHLTEAMNRALSDLFFNQGFCKPSFDQLIMQKNRA